MATDDAPGVSFHEFSAGGRTGDLIRGKDWSSTPLGPMAAWPRSLRNHLSMIFELPGAAIIFWGPEHIQLYNDGYAVIMGPRHPRHLGSTFRDCWPEAYPAIHPWMQRVLLGGQTVEVNRTLVALGRFGFTEEAYFTFSFSPLRDDQGAIAGILQLVTEVTESVLGERRETALHELSNLTARARTIQDAPRLAAGVLGRHAADVPFCLIYVVDPKDPQRLTLSASAGLPEDRQPFPREIDLRPEAVTKIPELARVVRERVAVPIEDLAARFGSLPAAPWPEPPMLALACPIAAADQQSVVAVLVAGISPRLRLDDHYRRFLEQVSAHVSTLVTAARAYDDERRRAEALAEIDRAKTEFFSNVSHEFRTPLTLILGPLQDALAQPSGSLAGEPLAAVHRNAERLMRLVNSLLDFARLEAGRQQTRFAPTDLATLTAGLASSFRSLAERSALDLVVDCPPLPEPVYVDASQWEKIVLNLVSNAYKFTLKGTIAVRLRWCGGHVELAVQDTGCGIPEAELPRVFQRFHRVEGSAGRSFEGTGIGLSLVEEFASIHGGCVSVSSTFGQGTTFVVSVPTGTAHLPPEKIVRAKPSSDLPAASAPYVLEATAWSDQEDVAAPVIPSVSAEGEDTVPETARERSRVLVADDNADMRKYLLRILGTRWQVDVAEDGQAALSAARQRPPDLVLSDVMMPRLDGLGLLRALRSDPRTREIPVVLLSARAGEESLLAGIETGADDYLVKPFSARELLARVQTHLGMSRLRRQWAAELEAANRELDAFAHSVSHDLRSPLRAVIGFSDLVARDHAAALPDKGREFLGHVVSAARRMDQLIEDLLRFSRVGQQSLSRGPVDVGALVREVLGELRADHAGRNVEIVVGELPDAQADRGLLKQVWANLLSNAFKFTRHRERALVEVGSRDGSGERVYLVRDNGAGFDMRYAQRLFGVFQRMHLQEEFEGTGVGLSLARRIVERHGGRMWAEAAVNEGATFYFTLPPGPEARTRAV
jgi:signal transduction histidine kinase